ncbi:MAG: beta-xylosidase [Verrucomicrobia bacterium]|nr:MAG: beta-xylosidase [Verrucomicrobiota bacterium]
MKHSYHTQHAPLGAFASFTLGLHGAPGGFGQSLGRPARQNVYVGYRYAGEPWALLPFFAERQNRAVDFTGDPDAPMGEGDVRVLPEGRYGRSLGWATDRWMAQAMVFSIATPFRRIEDPDELDEDEARRLLVPAVFARLEIDNAHMDVPVELVFGIHDPDQEWRYMGDFHTHLCGFSRGNHYGFATWPADNVKPRQAFDLFNPRYLDERGQHGIGTECGLIFEVPAGEKASFPIALGFFNSARITTSLRTHFYYSQFFDTLGHVLTSALENFDEAVATAAERDRELRASGLSADQQWIVAQATHSYLGSTEMLVAEDGRRWWVVNEGEYRMMNTFDLAVDQLFFELAWHPWAVRDILDLYVERYAYTDRVRLPEGGWADGGLSFTHDMGVVDQFSRPGHSSYECTGVTGCFSHMTMEELLNWICCAVTYVEKTGDHAWLKHHARTIRACAESLRRRDHPDPAKRNGILKCDSDRCGEDGAEITTYDSLDVSLGQARNNLYIAVKAVAAWVLLERAFMRLGDEGEAEAADEAIRLGVESICAQFETDTGMFPAVFEGGNRSRILPAAEGLVFLHCLGMDEELRREGRLGPLLDRLETHLANALQPGVCLHEPTGGWKISSTSDNTWISKVAIAQHLVRELFPKALPPDAGRADTAHAEWLRGPGCGPMAFCDQILASEGRAVGSRYYPRGVSSYLWLT